MMARKNRILVLVALMAAAGLSTIAQEQAKTASAPAGSEGTKSATHSSGGLKTEPASKSEVRAERMEGEKRFQTNCGRCHQAPHKFPPRIMATAIRHMRVRAMLTDEDMRLILRYMTQ
jgi:mono/diheme cytochrome c family protein